MSSNEVLNELECVGEFFRERVGVTLILAVLKESCESKFYNDSDRHGEYI